MAQVPTGTTFHVASSYAASQTTTAVSNASEAVVTCAAHGFSNGDIVEQSSGWGRLHLRVLRVKGVTTNNYTLEGFDTTNTTFFPAGAGVGSVRKISTFTQITGVMNPQSSGGEPKTVKYKFVESDVEYSINDGFAATDYNMEIDADQIGSAGYTAVKTLTDVQSNSCLKMVMRNNAVMYQPCTVALNEAIKMQDGQINRVTCAFNGNNRGSRYAS
jgi:hypothetical protein